jgi:Zn-dependent peptidase ImmA (M78 family)
VTFVSCPNLFRPNGNGVGEIEHDCEQFASAILL